MSDEEVYQTGRISGRCPGVVNGKRIYPKVNTAKPYKSGKGKLGKHQERLNNRRNAHSHTLKTLNSADNPAGWKTPGSMKQHNSG